MAEKLIWTFQDFVEILLTQGELSRDARSLKMARVAAVNAYQEVCKCYRWNYFIDRRTLASAADQTTGTIAYDHTGGTYEREVTLSDATWPANVEFGKITIGNNTYSIDERKSSTVITLPASSNPGADVAASTEYTWYRSAYPLPIDFKELLQIWDSTNTRPLELVSAGDLQDYDRYWNAAPSTPLVANVRNQREYFGSLQIEFAPPPDSVIVYDYMYTRRPRDLKIEKYATGTVSVSQDSTSVSGSGTTFPAGCEGSIIRFSADSTNEPTNVMGSFDATDNLMAYQRTIVTRTSATALVLDEAIPEALSGVKYTISDPLDIEPTMFTAVLREAEYQFSQMIRESVSMVQNRKREAIRALVLAKEDDDRQPLNPRPSSFNRFDVGSVTTES